MVYTTKVGRKDIKNSFQVYTTQEVKEDIKSNPRVSLKMHCFQTTDRKMLS